MDDLIQIYKITKGFHEVELSLRNLGPADEVKGRHNSQIVSENL
jgi:hypothetical protein